MRNTTAEYIVDEFLDGTATLVRDRDWRQALRNFVRMFRWTRQYLELGFCEADLWCAETHLATLIAPRIKKYRELFGGRSHPVEQANGGYFDFTNEQRRQLEKGLDLFRRWFFDLWD